MPLQGLAAESEELAKQHSTVQQKKEKAWTFYWDDGVTVCPQLDINISFYKSWRCPTLSQIRKHEDSTVIAIPEACPLNCNSRGDCRDGTCQCRDGWTGLSCQDLAFSSVAWAQEKLIVPLPTPHNTYIRIVIVFTSASCKKSWPRSRPKEDYEQPALVDFTEASPERFTGLVKIALCW